MSNPNQNSKAKRSRLEPEFIFESASVLDPDGESFGLIRVSLDLYVTDEGNLELDGDPILELIAGPNEVTVREVRLFELDGADKILLDRQVRSYIENASHEYKVHVTHEAGQGYYEERNGDE